MLIPALFGFVFLAVIERWNVSHQAAGHHQPEKRPVHDFVISILLFVLCTFHRSITARKTKPNSAGISITKAITAPCANLGIEPRIV